MKTHNDYLFSKPLDEFLGEKTNILILSCIVLITFPLLMIVGSLYNPKKNSGEDVKNQIK